MVIFPLCPLSPPISPIPFSKISTKKTQVVEMPEDLFALLSISHPKYPLWEKKHPGRDTIQRIDSLVSSFQLSFRSSLYSIPRETGGEIYQKRRGLAQAESGCYKGWKFLLSVVTEKEKGTLLKALGSNQNSCLIIACHMIVLLFALSTRGVQLFVRKRTWTCAKASKKNEKRVNSKSRQLQGM